VKRKWNQDRMVNSVIFDDREKSSDSAKYKILNRKGKNYFPI